MTTFVEYYHPALPGTPHIEVPLGSEGVYAAHGWVAVDGSTPAPDPIFLTPGNGDLRYLKTADVGTSGTVTGNALKAALVPFWEAAETVTAGTVRMDPTGHTITRNSNGTTRSTYDATEQALWTIVSGGGGGSVSSASITDATTVGKAVLTAADAPTARTAIGAGTSSYTPPTQTGQAGKFLTTDGTTASWGPVPSANSGVRKPGSSIPRGSLDVWDAARTASASQQRDLVLFGDSTTEGILNTGANGAGYVPTLRSLMVGDGVTDGGRGQIDGTFDSATVSGESLAGFVSRTGWAAAATNTPPGPNPFNSSTVADALTLQYKAPSNAMRVRCSSNNSTGRITVAVNGTTVGTVDPWVAQNQSGTLGTYGQMAKVFTGLTAGGTGQTVTITNTGGAPIPDPFQFRTAGTATTGGALAPGNYTYAATFVDATGKETALSPKGNQTVPAGTSTNTVTTALDNSGSSTGNVPSGITKARLYRASGLNVTTASSFQMVLEVTTSGGAQIILTDVGNAPGATAPSASQSPFSDPANGGPKNASITVEFYDSTKGITLQRAGYSGQKYVQSFNPAGQPISAANFDTQTHLGLQTGLGGPGFDWTVIPDTSGNQRKPALAVAVYGINDMNQATAQTDIIPAVQNGVAAFVRFCRAAGCDALVVIPHLEYAVDAAHLTYLAQVRDAILNTADAHGVAWVNFSRALPALNAANATTYGGVHLTQAGYDAEANYLWSNVLAATAPR